MACPNVAIIEINNLLEYLRLSKKIIIATGNC
jgi:hypothetical protein